MPNYAHIPYQLCHDFDGVNPSMIKTRYNRNYSHDHHTYSHIIIIQLAIAT